MDLKNNITDSNSKENEKKFQTFMTNNQTKKEQEKSVFTIAEFLDEELEFLKEENISIEASDSKWMWLTNELAEKYFVSVLLPYYVVKPNISYNELYQLGFRTFVSELNNKKLINFSTIKSKYLKSDVQNQINFLNKSFGIDIVNKKLENARNRLLNPSKSINELIFKHNDKFKIILSQCENIFYLLITQLRKLRRIIMHRI